MRKLRRNSHALTLPHRTAGERAYDRLYRLSQRPDGPILRFYRTRNDPCYLTLNWPSNGFEFEASGPSIYHCAAVIEKELADRLLTFPICKDGVST